MLIILFWIRQRVQGSVLNNHFFTIELADLGASRSHWDSLKQPVCQRGRKLAGGLYKLRDMVPEKASAGVIVNAQQVLTIWFEALFELLSNSEFIPSKAQSIYDVVTLQIVLLRWKEETVGMLPYRSLAPSVG